MKSQVFWSKSIEVRVKKWLDIAQYNEIPTVITTLGTGINRILLSLENEPERVKYLSGSIFEKVKCIDLRSVNIDKLEPDSYFGEYPSKAILVINGLEQILTDKNSYVLMYLIERHRKRGDSMIFVSSNNILNTSIYKEMLTSISYYPVVEHYGLLSKVDAREYVTQKLSNWGKTIPDNLIGEVCELSGGWMVLLKKLVWNYVMGDKSEIEGENLRVDTIWVLDRLWRNFSYEEQEIIEKIFTDGLSIERQTSSLMYLISIGLVQQKGKGYIITSSLLGRYLQQYVINSTLSRDDLVVDGVELSHKLTSQQLSILRLLASKVGQVVTREEIAESVWLSVDVSDWAIDGQVSRIRAKLRELGCHDGHIITKKKQGYVWQT